jgi:hypothetical protein
MWGDVVRFHCTELEVLAGAKITRVWVENAPDDGFSFPEIRISVKYRKNLVVNGETEGVYALWQDEEGNGPGYLAFMGGEN